MISGRDRIGKEHDIQQIVKTGKGKLHRVIEGYVLSFLNNLFSHTLDYILAYITTSRRLYIEL
jgi:hypothetical protein